MRKFTAARPSAILASLVATALHAGCTSVSPGNPTGGTEPKGSVIFIHPDGGSAATWAAARALLVGPDADLEWDKLPQVGLYRGHLANSLTGTSNGGATVHAYGVKVEHDAFGRSAGGERGTDLVDASGKRRSVAIQALAAGIPVGLVQTGIAPEPGTACFLVSTQSRRDYDAIAAGLIESGAQVLLSGGECYFLPEGVQGVHGLGVRTDGRDLIAEARQLGYAVVRTRKELETLDPGATRVLGLFAHKATFNDQIEEALAAKSLPLYDPSAPTVAEMTEAAIRILTRSSDQFLLVVEEEGTDNFGNKNNASGVLEAAKRADAAIGVAREHLRERPNTLVLTVADSDGGGMRMVGIPVGPGLEVPATLPPRSSNGSPIDGVEGEGGAPFLAAPDASGRRLPFYIVWSSFDDVSGGVLARAEGLNAERVRGSTDNADLADLMRVTLFGTASAGGGD